MSNSTLWKEEFLNEDGEKKPGSKQAQEEIFFDKLREQIMEVVKHYQQDNDGHLMRANHAKILAGVVGAEFRVSSQISPDLAVGFLQPGRAYKAHVRFSNASGEFTKDDAAPDLRGVAIRVLTDQGDHDFLMTNADPHHAKDAREAMVTIVAATKKDAAADRFNDIVGNAAFLAHLGFHVPKSARRIVKTLRRQLDSHVVNSLAAETYSSRAPIAIGTPTTPEQSVAVKYQLTPAPGGPEHKPNPANLGGGLKDSIRDGEVKFLFQVQRFVNLETTPIEDSTVEWPSPFETIAELVIPQNAEVNDNFINGLVYNPWNVDESNFRPLGSMNRSRRKVYEASAKARGGLA